MICFFVKLFTLCKNYTHLRVKKQVFWQNYLFHRNKNSVESLSLAKLTPHKLG
jgi:hypothetical protein